LLTVDWSHQLVEQVDFHWSRLARPRLDGLTDDEYFREPVPGCWSVRAREGHDGTIGGFGIDSTMPEPEPEVPPFTTLAWRIGHLVVDVLGYRTHSLFDGPPVDRSTFPYAATASEALSQLDDAYHLWTTGVSAMNDRDLGQSCSEDERLFAGEPRAALILHINRELLCHCAEVGLLRDLYASRS
jgi:hypothetical protein